MITFLFFVCLVQSQDTDVAMQQERVLWQQEKEALVKELEQMRKEAVSAPPSRRTTSPPKSPSPSEENPDIEISMTKVCGLVAVDPPNVDVLTSYRDTFNSEYPLIPWF